MPEFPHVSAEVQRTSNIESDPYSRGVYPLPDRRRRAAIRPSPVFLAVLGVTAFGGLLAWTSSTVSLARIGVFVFVLGGWVASICLHEFAHAYAAYRAGDHSVESAGYLTLNPLKYVNPLLSIVLPLLFIVLGGIGMPGGAVYLHRHSFRSRAALSLAAAAGPASNIVFAGALLTLAKSQGSGGAHLAFWSAVAFLGFLQVSAAVLNLLPIPGFDGYAIIEPYLNPATARSLEPAKAWGMIALFVLIQVHQVNTVFFDLIGRGYRLFGASEDLWRIGYALFRFWQRF
jgi:Zn-dependent protease